MSLAGDILREAIERSRRINDDHVARVSEAATELTNHLGKPWKFKVDAIREIQESAKQPEAPAE